VTILDAHVHFIDPDRPGGIPFPDPSDPLYRRKLPRHLRAAAGLLGVTGAIAIEWSDRPADNQWLLDLAADDPFVVGVVGNLAPGTPGFAARLQHYSRNKRFVGIRCGTPWSPIALADAQFRTDVRALADAGLALDVVQVGGGGVDLLLTLVALLERIPELRIVIDHLPFPRPDDLAARGTFRRALGSLAKHAQVYVKVSNVLPRSGPVSNDPDVYTTSLDELFALFGPDRVMYGSNWPVSGRIAPYPAALGIAETYVSRYRSAIADRFFEGNARSAYRIW
jgi:L-fuconolactonase